MPQIKGIEALQEIKQIQPDTDVIMITAHASEENITAAKALEVHGFIVKPFDVNELRNYVDMVLSRKVDCE